MKQTALLRRPFPAVLGILIATVLLPGAPAQQKSAAAPAGILQPAQTASLMPDQVFFRGQSATVQMRNTWGIRYPDGMLTLTGLVDTSGYSTGVQQKYQLYLITEVPLAIGGATPQVLRPGAYGAGFVEGHAFVVMDLGAHELFRVQSQSDASMARPRPLEIADGGRPGAYRLYDGRSFIEFQRAR